MNHKFDIRKDAPLATVVTTTYNHALYIRKCLDSVLKQQTDFPFEYIVHDDASTDGTAEIVREYAERYPHTIVPIMQKENQHSKNIIIANITKPLIRGKYRAICEGDDYWHNPCKLALQVAYLEQHPECGLVHGNVNVFDVTAGKRTSNYRDYQAVVCGDDDPDITWHILAGTYPIFTCTACYRVSVAEQIRQSDPGVFTQRRFKMGDLPMWVEISRRAKVHYIPESLATYQILHESASHSRDARKRLAFAMSCRDVREYYLEKYQDDCSAEMKINILGEWTRRLLPLAWDARNYEVARNALTMLYSLGIKPTAREQLLFHASRPLAGSLLKPVVDGLRILKRIAGKR